MSAPHLICWDMDETLGWFRPVADVLVNELSRSRLRRAIETFFGATTPPPIQVREGIADVLRQLRERGFRQVVTTGGFREYAERSLSDAGLAGHFDGVFARDAIWDGWGKRYQPVLDRFGATPDRTVIIGDDWKKDRGVDHPAILLVCQPEGWRKPASLLTPLLEGLAESGSFAAGFERLVATSTPDAFGRRGRVRNVGVRLAHWGNVAKGDLTPVLSEIAEES